MSAPVSLSGLDVAFLALETPNIPMNVMGILVLDASGAGGRYSFERVVRLMEARGRHLAPFRRRLVPVPFDLDQPVWIDDPALDIRSHIHRVAAPPPGSDRVLAEMVARIASQPLARTRPLWELRVIEGLSEGRVALVFKVHHAAADGVSAAALLLQLLDSSPDAADPGEPRAGELPAPAPTSVALLAHAASRLPERATRLVQLLRDSAASVGAMARSRVGGAGAGAGMPNLFSAPRAPWNRAISSERTVAFERAQLADVKTIGAAFGASVNHVVLAACTQTLRSYLQAHGGAPDRPLVAAIPLSLRSAAEPGSDGNHLSAFFVHLPVHLSDPLEQLLAISRDSDSSRQHHTRLGVSALGEWAAFTSTRLLAGAARFYSGLKLADRHRPLFNLVVSNVRGPGAPLYAAGARLVAAYPLGPPMEGIGANITVLSYAGSVDFGIIACARSAPHVADIALGFGAAVGRLLKTALEKTAETSAVAREGEAGSSTPAAESAGGG